MYLIACDIGFGYTKFMEVIISSDKAEIIQKDEFPSSIRHILSIDGFNIKEHPDYVELKEKGYYVGYSALASDKGLRIRSSEFMLENLPILLNRVFKVKKLDKTPDVLMIGTPFQEWRRLKEQFISSAKEYSEKVYCVPQAAAASLIIPAKDDFLMIDIGYNTCDLVPIDKKGQILADEGISWEKLGVSALLDDLDYFIKNTLGIALSPSNLEKILQKPKSIKKIFSNIPDNLIEQFGNKIGSIIQNKFYFLNAKIIDKFGKNYSKMVLVGGGANIYKKYFKDYYTKKVVIPNNPTFANVKGFVLLGLSYLKFNGEVLWDKPDNQEKVKRSIEQQAETKDKKSA